MSTPAIEPQPAGNLGFIKLLRGDVTEGLLRDEPKAFLLLTLIAYRAQRSASGWNRHGLEIGEAFIGDHENCGLSRQEHRTALRKLETLKIVTSRATNKGTIAKLIDSGVYDINADAVNQQSNQRPTSSQPAPNQQPTTTKNVKNGRMEEEEGEARAREPHFPEIEAPSESEVLTEADRIGLAPWVASKFWREMESVGWVDKNKRPVKKWKPMLTTIKGYWESDGRPMSPPTRQNGFQKPQALKPDHSKGFFNENNR